MYAPKAGSRRRFPSVTKQNPEIVLAIVETDAFGCKWPAISPGDDPEAGKCLSTSAPIFNSLAPCPPSDRGGSGS